MKEEVNQTSKLKISIISEKIANITSFLNGIVLIGMMGLLFIQVLSRYVFHNPIAWSEELIRYSFILSTYFGSAVAVQKYAHVEIDILPAVMNKVRDENLRRKINKILDITANLICIVFMILFSYLVYELVQATSLNGQSSTVLGIPLTIISAGILVSSVLMVFHFIVNLIELIFDKGGA